MDTASAEQFLCAPVYRQESGYISMFLSYDAQSPDAPKRVFIGSGYRIYVVEGGPAAPSVRLGGANDIKDFYTYGADSGKVLLQMRHYEARVMVIYN
jgi:hypothetical protein